jgi:hypothetical protein
MSASVAAALSAIETPRRNLTVNETSFDAWIFGNQHAKNEHTISAEEAAQIGAQYIYEIFGECIDGATVQMSFNGHLRHKETLGVWSGTVGDGIIPDDIVLPDGMTMPEFPIGKPMFMFMLNAETGEAIHVERMTFSGDGDGIIIFTPRSNEGVTMDIPGVFGCPEMKRREFFDGDEEIRREIYFYPINPSDEQGTPWELPDNVIRIDDLDEWLQNNNSSIIRRFTPRADFHVDVFPNPNKQPQENGNGNGDGRQT